jgi:hypothetical protein
MNCICCVLLTLPGSDGYYNYQRDKKPALEEKPFSLFKGQDPPTKVREEGVRKRNPLFRKKDGLRSKRI